MTSTKLTDPFASSKAPGLQITEATAIKLECRQLLEEIKETCERLPVNVQHLFAADCTQRNRLVFNIFCNEDEQLKEAYCANVVNFMNALHPESFKEEDEPLRNASLAAFATIADPFTAALYSNTTLLACAKDFTSRETEVRWQWERCLHYFRHGTPPEPQPEAMAATSLRELMPATRRLSRPSVDELRNQDEQIALLCSVLSEREQHLFIADCAERVLHVFEKAFPNETRPREAIRLRRLFAAEKISPEEWRAAWIAAFCATEEATQRGPRSVSRRRWARKQSAVIAAAAITFLEVSDIEQAANVAASALRSNPKAVDAEREWQLTRLFYYLRGEPPVGPV